MDLYLQFGHGMMGHSRHLIDKWGQGTVILSPRDLEPEQLERLSRDIVGLQGETLVDPQFYNPRATHPRLTGYNYWPEDFSTDMLTDGPALNNLLHRLKELNDNARTTKYIIPSIYCERVDDDWIATQEATIRESESVFSDKERLATICISSEVLRFEDQIEMLLNCSESWNMDGYYIVPEHPAGQYLVDDPLWLTNLLILCSGLKLQGKEVIVGYCSHQLLCLAAANVDAICAGTWLNVRSFSTSRFQQPEEDSTSRRATWYYCPQALSEYKLAFLDMGSRSGILNQLMADAAFGSDYAQVLFSGAQPSSTDYSEQPSFRHYLHCLHHQCSTARRNSFTETVSSHSMLLETAENLIRTLHRCGVRGQDRDFANMIDVNKAALDALVETRGFVLERQW